jgi:hypothetical protein
MTMLSEIRITFEKILPGPAYFFIIVTPLATGKGLQEFIFIFCKRQKRKFAAALFMSPG